MKIIKMLSEMIEDKIECAEDYAKAAIDCKSEYPEVSKTLIAISENEMNNVNSLHAVVAKIITEYRKESGDPPAPMMAVYDYLHKKHIENAARVKTMQAMYKEG
jgi:hypothetical protein